MLDNTSPQEKKRLCGQMNEERDFDHFLSELKHEARGPQRKK